jgi:hypothetical protein
VRSRLTSFAAALLIFAVAAPAHAQDFLFGAPRAQLTLRGGPVVHRADSDLFDFMTRELTLGRRDFVSPSFGAELSIRAHRRFDVQVGAAYTHANARSEYRDWIGEDDEPIEQTTRLQTVPMTLSVRAFPLPRGTEVSPLAWVPERITPYVGLGAGAIWYRLDQQGEFLQASDLTIFPDSYQSNGYGTTGHVLAGVDYWLTPRFGLNLDGRYRIGSAALRDDYRNWEPLDLSGFHGGLGLTLRW